MNHPLFFKQITDLAGAKTLLRYLHANGLSYHCEDNAHTIEDPVTGPLFTDDEAEALNHRMNECYSLDWPDYIGCPCGYALHLDPDYTAEILKRGEGDEDDARRLAAEIEVEKAADLGMRPVAFRFEDGEPLHGFTKDEQWNGFLVVYVGAAGLDAVRAAVGPDWDDWNSLPVESGFHQLAGFSTMEVEA